MWKQNRSKIVTTTLAALLPCLIGLVLWQRLPELVPIHFNFNGAADDWADKSVVVFALPGFFLVCHIICLFVMLHDSKIKETGGSLISILLWILPVVSLVTCVCIYAYALHMRVNIAFVCINLIGIFQIVLGNLLPKLKFNHIIGLRTSWTLANPENWYHTHRVAGWSCVLTGILILATALSMNIWLMLALLTVPIVVSTAYSYVYYQQHGGEG